MQFEAEIARREKMLGTGLGERMNSLRGVKEVSWDAEGWSTSGAARLACAAAGCDDDGCICSAEMMEVGRNK